MAGLQDIFLAGVGALAITTDKAKEVVDKLIEQGQLTVEEGRELNSELQHRANEGTAKASDTASEVIGKVAAAVTPLEELGIEARLRAMTEADRAAFVERIAKIAADIDAKAEEVAEAEVVEPEAAETESEA
jgi:polyhydroxyalkanoate synthesis regulator phasin